MVGHIQVPDFLIHFPHLHIQFFSNNASVLMLSFMLLLSLKKSDSLCFWRAIISNPLSP